MVINQTDCFNFNMIFWKLLGVWPAESLGRYYKYYSIAFVMIFQIFYDLLCSINFYFLPRDLDSYVEEMLFYFTELAITSKALTFFFMHDKIVEIFRTLQSDIFQPATDVGVKIIENAKKFNKRYWKIVFVISATSNLTHWMSPFITHLLLSVELVLPVCSYSFLPEEIKEKYIYPLYLYQSLGIHFHMLYNVHIETFFLGIMVLAIAQLDILYINLQNITNELQSAESSEGIINYQNIINDDNMLIARLNKAVIHYDEVNKFCSLVQEVFSVTLFVQFGMASCVICTCAFRFILPAPWQYFIFLGTYMFVMIIGILVPCWFGTRIIDKSFALSQAVYSCDWTPRSRRFKSSKRIFVERIHRPLSITGWKMFPLSLKTFTSIMNTAYSFFTLLLHMQTRRNLEN